MGYLGDIGKVVSGSAIDILKSTPSKIELTALKAGAKATNASLLQEVSKESTELISNMAFKATKYGIYGAIGTGVVGSIAGAANPNQTMINGSINGAGLGAIGGASVGAIATAIAKGIR